MQKSDVIGAPVTRAIINQISAFLAKVNRYSISWFLPPFYATLFKVAFSWMTPKLNAHFVFNFSAVTEDVC